MPGRELTTRQREARRRRRMVEAIGTATWAHHVSDERLGHRMIDDVPADDRGGT